MPLALADSALEQIPAGFEDNHFKGSSDSNALLGCKSGSLGRRSLLRFPAGQVPRLGWLQAAAVVLPIQCPTRRETPRLLPPVSFTRLIDAALSGVNLVDKCLVRWFSAAGRFQQDLKAIILKSSDSNALSCKSGSLGRVIASTFPAGQVAERNGGFTCGNSCPFNVLTQAGISSPVCRA